MSPSMRRVIVLLGVLGALLTPLPAVADEAKAAINPMTLLNVLASPIEPRASAFDKALKEPGPAPRAPAGEVQPDGSVRYGSVVVTVKNPCPPGTSHYEPPPLPGRRARN